MTLNVVNLVIKRWWHGSVIHNSFRGRHRCSHLLLLVSFLAWTSHVSLFWRSSLRRCVPQEVEELLRPSWSLSCPQPHTQQHQPWRRPLVTFRVLSSITEERRLSSDLIRMKFYFLCVVCHSDLQCCESMTRIMTFPGTSANLCV